MIRLAFILQITRDIYGKYVTVPLIPGGSEKIVNKQNRCKILHFFNSPHSHSLKIRSIQVSSWGCFPACNINGSSCSELCSQPSLQCHKCPWEEVLGLYIMQGSLKGCLPASKVFICCVQTILMLPQSAPERLRNGLMHMLMELHKYILLLLLLLLLLYLLVPLLLAQAQV